jgi:phospholipid/cholesterol/gamma-HCH transport system substrate-binding protein
MSALTGRHIGLPLAKLAIFAAVTLMLTMTLATTLGSLSASGTTYRAQFADVAGLLRGDDVRIAGVRVGEVTRIRLVGDVAEVSFTVDEQVPLDAGVLAKIRYRNLVGQRYLALTEGAGGGRRLVADGLIPLSQTTPALDLTVVFNGFRPLFVGLSPPDINRFAFEIIQVLQGEGGTMASLLARTASLTNSLADRDALIGQVIDNLNAVLGTVAHREANFDEMIVRLQQFVTGLSGDREAIGAAISSIADLAAVTGSFLADARPDLSADITLLNSLAGTLNDNTEVIDSTLRRLPGRYEALSRTALYGSWFNFFLCDFDGRVGLLPGLDDARPSFSSAQARCGALTGSAGGR